MRNEKLTWIAEFKDKMSGGLKRLDKSVGLFGRSTRAADLISSRAFNSIRNNISKAQKELGGFFNKANDTYRDDNGRLRDSTTNRFVKDNKKGFDIDGGILSGATAVAAILGKASMRAAEFNTAFRELDTLNLDKTNTQIEGLRNNVLDTAFAAGKAPEKMNQAFYDIQSISGKYGDEVSKIASRISQFSSGTQSDFNQQVIAGATIMDIYGSSVKDLDKILESAAKTVQVGKVNFEQLARVQVDYLGAASAGNQGIDEANKLFAVFSKRSKSAEEAATLTKGAFQDLFKSRTVKAFKSLKINVFDKESGKAKALSRIVGELAPKLEGLNDKGVSKLINQFGGNEGLRALITEIATGGNQMVQMFEDFDNSKFNIDEAFSKARRDVNALSESLKNKLAVIMIRLGEKILPSVEEWLTKIDKKMPKILETVGKLMIGIEKTFSQITALWGTIKTIGNSNIFGAVVNSTPLGGIKKLHDLGRKQLTNKEEKNKNREFTEKFDVFREIPNVDFIGKGILDFADTDPQRKALVRGMSNARDLSSQGDKIGSLVALRKNFEASGIDNTESKLLISELNKRVDSLMRKDKVKFDISEGKRLFDFYEGNGSALTGTDASGKANSKNIGLSNLGDEMSSVTGSSKVRNFTININQLVGEIKNIVNEGSVGFDDIREMVEQALISAVRDVELTVASE